MVAIYVLIEVRRGGRYRQRGRYIQGCYIQWALYMIWAIIWSNRALGALMIRLSTTQFGSSEDSKAKNVICAMTKAFV